MYFALLCFETLSMKILLFSDLISSFRILDSSHVCISVMLLPLQVTQFIKLVRDRQEMDIFLQPLQVSKKQFALFPVNDSESRSHAGGSHWSLLFLDVKKQTFHHYDSHSQANHRTSQLLATQMADYLKLENSKFVEEDTPQQTNSYDCGVYVIIITELLCKEYSSSRNASCISDITPSDIMAKRTELKELVYKLKTEMDP